MEAIPVTCAEGMITYLGAARRAARDPVPNRMEDRVCALTGAKHKSSSPHDEHS